MQSLSWSDGGAVPNIYQTSLDAKFRDIMQVISSQYGYGHDLSGLTAEVRDTVERLSEQAILNWAVGRTARGKTVIPFTNLQHLLDEYCALAEYL